MDSKDLTFFDEHLSGPEGSRTGEEVESLSQDDAEEVSILGPGGSRRVVEAESCQQNNFCCSISLLWRCIKGDTKEASILGQGGSLTAVEAESYQDDAEAVNILGPGGSRRVVETESCQDDAEAVSILRPGGSRSVVEAESCQDDAEAVSILGPGGSRSVVEAESCQDDAEAVSILGPGGSRSVVEAESCQGLLDLGTSSEQRGRTLIEEKKAPFHSLVYPKNKSNRRGTDYEHALAILFLKRAVESGTSFRLATERKDDEKFDDMFLEVGDSEKRIYYLQAKHKEDSSKKISFDQLSSKGDSNYSLLKYLNSYRKLKGKTKGVDFMKAMFLLSTTIDLDKERLKKKGVLVQEFPGEDLIFGKAGERFAKVYLLRTTSAEVRDELFGEARSGIKSRAKGEGEDAADPDEFLDKLMFVVTPKEDRLRRILKDEMKEEFGDREGEVIYDTLHYSMMDWMTSLDEGGMGVYLTKDKNPYSEAVEKHALPCWFEVKQPVSTFTGREEDLTSLHQMLVGGDQFGDAIVRKVIVLGMGGLGKSELARKYAENNKKHYRGNVIWINADTDAVYGSFTRLAEELKIIESFDHSKENDAMHVIIESSDHKAIDGRLLAREVYKRFARKESLFIFDNAQNYREIEPFLPNLGISSFAPKILITTRNRELFRAQEHGNVPRLYLDLFSTETAMEFFGKAVKRWVDIRSKEEEHVRTLVETLGGLPLAMQHAAAYVNRTSCSLLGYNRLLKESKNFMESFLSRNNLDSYDTTIYVTFKVTIDKILKEEEEGKFSVEILRIIAYMAPDMIPSRMFKPLAISEFTGEKETVRDNMANDLLEISLRLLLQYSLIEAFVYRNSKYFKVHRMVQYVTRQYIRGESVAGEHGRAALSQTSEVPNDYGPEESALRKGMDLACDFIKVDNISLLRTHIFSLCGHADGKASVMKSFIAKRFIWNYTALHLISEYGTPELLSSVLRTLSDTGTDPDSGEALLKDVIEAKDEFDNTPMYYAASSGNLEKMKVLITSGACVNVKGFEGSTPLHKAAKGGSEGCVRYLVEEVKFDIKTADHKGALPVDVAAVYGHVPVVRYLLEKSHYDPIERSMYLLHAILHSDSGSVLTDMDEVFEGLTPEVAKRVIQRKMKNEVFWPRNAVKLAVFKHDEDAVGYLMEKGGLVEAEDFVDVLEYATEHPYWWWNLRVVRWALDKFPEDGMEEAEDESDESKFILDHLSSLSQFYRNIYCVDKMERIFMQYGRIHMLKFLMIHFHTSLNKNNMSHADKISKAKRYLNQYLKDRGIGDLEEYASPQTSHWFDELELTPLNVWCVLDELERVKVYLEGVATSNRTLKDIEVSIKLAELYDNEEIVDYLVVMYPSV